MILSRTDVQCCHTSEDDEYTQLATPGLYAGRCYMTLEDSWPVQWVDNTQPVWQASFSGYCTLNSAAKECGQGLCAGMQLAASGAAYSLLAYSTTNPTALPAMDNCDLRDECCRQAGRNTTAEQQEFRRRRKASKPGKAAQVNSGHRGTSGQQQQVWLGYVWLYSGLLTQARSHVHDVHYEGYFEYVQPVRGCSAYEDPNNSGDEVQYRCEVEDGSRVCGCYRYDTSTDEYIWAGPPGWRAVDISAVPQGTPLVDGRINTYTLKLYEE